MVNSNQDIADLERVFRDARSQLSDAGSVHDAVRNSVFSATIRQRPKFVRLLLATAALLIIAVYLRDLSGPSNGVGRVDFAALPTDLQLDLGNIDIIEHLATHVGRHSVLGIWSYRGPNLTAMRAEESPSDAGKYRHQILRKNPVDGGRTLVCSLFLPDPSAGSELEPPSVWASTADHQAIACRTALRTMSAPQLQNGMHSTGLGDVLRDSYAIDKTSFEATHQKGLP